MSGGTVRVVGYCDGIKGDDLYGWAWAPDEPERSVEIDVCLGDVVLASTVATIYRADLRAAGIGNGRYGWRLALPRPAQGSGPLALVARARGGDMLADGAFNYDPEPAAADAGDPDLQEFIRAVTDPAAARPAPPPPRARPVTHFLLYSAAAPDSRALGAAEYSYGFVMKAFRPLFEQLGRVHLVDGGQAQVERIVETAIAAGEAAVLISFAPPHRTPLELRCPIVPVVAWEFPTIPNRVWDGEPRHDWTFVLRQTGRAITLSDDAAAAMRAAMGRSFPAIGVPTPVWDRFPELHTLGAPGGEARLAIDGFVLDTRGRAFVPGAPIPGVPDASGAGPAERLPAETVVDGVVFTAVLAPKDGRKSWPDILTAFIAAFGETPDATLVIKMIGTDPGLWWWEAHELLGKERPFACRIVILHGYLDEQHYNALIAASHWIVNASKAEGQCLPLLEFMSAGRPAIAPRHTAMADYITADNALILATSEEYCGWPHDPVNEMTTIRHRVDWSALQACYRDAYALTRDDPEGYARRGAAARETMRGYCSDAVVAARLDAFLGLGLDLGVLERSPAGLLAEDAAR